MAQPTLVLVTGPAGTGKTTLAHELAPALGCPAICRDEIKEGMLYTIDGPFEAAPGDDLTLRATGIFFETLRRFLDAAVTVVAEAAFQHPVWEQHLAPLGQSARLRVIRCWTKPEVALARLTGRGLRAAHADASIDARYFETFAPIAVAAPTLDVETTSGYQPTLEEIVSFIDHE